MRLPLRPARLALACAGALCIPAGTFPVLAGGVSCTMLQALAPAVEAPGPPAAAGPWEAPAAREAVLQVRAVDGTGTLIPESVGGARITIREFTTGIVVAEGWQEGRPETVPFATTIDLSPLPQPAELEITAEGPLAHPQATRRAATTLRLAPGEEPPAEGIVLTLRGLIVEVLEPPEPEPAGDDTLPGGQPLLVHARVRLLAGQPAGDAATAGGPLRVVARLEQGPALLQETLLEAAGEAGFYTGSVTLPPSGQVDLVVQAATPDGDDAGKLRRHLYLAPETHATGNR